MLADSEAMSDVTEFIPSGLTGLDEILGGGWAVGRASEVYGPETSGKSALSHLAIQQCQRLGGIAAMLDFENSLDKHKMQKLGIDPARLLYHIPDTLEEGWETVHAIYAAVKKNPPEHPILVVWDSIAAAIPDRELKGDSGEVHPGLIAKLMRQGCRKVLRSLTSARMHLMWINQTSAKIGAWGGFGAAPTTTSGGGGAKFASSQRVESKKVKTCRAQGKTGRAIGYLISTKTTKNRITDPEQKCEWFIDFKLGPNDAMSVLQVLLDPKVKGGIRHVSKGKYRLAGTKPQFRKPDWPSLVADDPELWEKARELYLAVTQAGGPKAMAEAIAEAKGEVDEDGELTEET